MDKIKIEAVHMETLQETIEEVNKKSGVVAYVTPGELKEGKYYNATIHYTMPAALWSLATHFGVNLATKKFHQFVKG